jgi:hypothetical protein
MLENIIQKVNPTLTRLTTSAAALAGLVYGAEQLPDISSPTMATIGASAALGLYGIDKLTKAINQRFIPMKSKIQTGILAGLLGICGYSLFDEVKDIKTDIESIISKIESQSPHKINEEEARKLAKSLKAKQNYKLPNFRGIKLAKKESYIGSAQRTHRFKPIIDAVEKKYNIPKGVLEALVMHESYGDPLQPNKGNDGGIGLIHTQGPTATGLGLKIHGTSKSSRDVKHGKKLKKLFEKCNNVLECVSEYDDRAHPLKNLDAIARYMMQGYRAHKNWDAAIQWVHGPGHVNKPRGKRYLAKVKAKRKIYNKLEKLKEDFKNRNSKFTWNQYQGSFHRFCEENFDLKKYK